MSAGLRAGRPSRSAATPNFAEVAVGEDEVVRINFNVRRDVRTALKVYAARHDTTISELLTAYVERLLASER